jgi:hypothetical protein
MLAAQQQTFTSEAVLAAELVTLAARGLKQMYEPQQGLFCFKLKRSPKGMVREGVSHRYTVMTLLGLHRLERTGTRSPIDINAVLERLTVDTKWICNIGDLGLLLWLCALVAPDRLRGLAAKTETRQALRQYRDAQQCSTMELAWFLSGLSHSLSTGQRCLSDLADDAQITFDLLKANQGGTGIFGHVARGKSAAGLLRGNIGSFADQVYPIYAFAKFLQCTGNHEAGERASDCARMICNLQGPLGEWWWHYNSSTGRVLETYPVYSVHQDGMAPMALSALGEVTGADFTGPIAKGLSWIAGHNELGIDLRCQESALIWRNLQLLASERYLRRIFRSAIASPTPVSKLGTNYECRPYELGWALYALAGK